MLVQARKPSVANAAEKSEPERQAVMPRSPVKSSASMSSMPQRSRAMKAKGFISVLPLVQSREIPMGWQGIQLSDRDGPWTATVLRGPGSSGLSQIIGAGFLKALWNWIVEKIAEEVRNERCKSKRYCSWPRYNGQLQARDMRQLWP